MPLSPWRPSFGTASGDCVNTCSSYHFSLGLSAGATGPGPGPGRPHLRQNRTENYTPDGGFFWTIAFSMGMDIWGNANGNKFIARIANISDQR